MYRAALACLSVVIVVCCATPAITQSERTIAAIAAKVSMIDIAYEVPKSVEHMQIYTRLRDRQVLEQMRNFLAPLKLKHRLLISIETCGRVNAFYFPAKKKVAICYEWVHRARNLAPQKPTAEGVSYEDMVVGAFVGITLHELGHAIFHLFGIPLLGREEDAADYVAAFILLQFGKNVARRTIAGKAQYWDSVSTKRRARQKTDYADEHGTDHQRFYNTLCIAYGHDPKSFEDYVQKKILPESRAKRCRGEYLKFQFAFRRLILPHIDRAMMEKVRQVEWLRPDDGKP